MSFENVHPNLIIEPFCSGSHRQLVTFIEENYKCDCISLTGKKWHWRARCSALYISQKLPKSHSYKTIFASSVLNLAELLALRPDLQSTRKILYFHENQLIYPIQRTKDGDYQYGYNQILSSMVADDVYFNSKFNMNSFLGTIKSFIKKIPDYAPSNIENEIEMKCKVLYFPVSLPNIEKPMVTTSEEEKSKDPIHFVWPHRWEHDKNPDLFFNTLFKLLEEGLDFKVSILGEQYEEIPAIFNIGKERLKEKIQNWGFAESKSEFFRILSTCDVVVSTAIHEFFGVSMIEATHIGCQPLAPNRLSYPEIFPESCLYNTDTQLLSKMRKFCKRPDILRRREKIEVSKYSSTVLKKEYDELFNNK
ncbi:DgyrCDS486 [Dimorphilus gyrociliatus]|uniref:tRNA-queuosine alpha-mannosyltransferase n=1 Tax=Dimorphilus gyrociliatus TaxID=2664684 RepID=A0A7I8V4T9_9ANNE|nr:DgyrCDS486 [Dimorphilus gyrociliatus]